VKLGVVALVFRCTPLGEPCGATEEAAEVRWMTLDEVHEAMAPAYAVRVADAFGAGTRTRAHDGVNLVS
jgi:8-oxo-dGTP diphosphatase